METAHGGKVNPGKCEYFQLRFESLNRLSKKNFKKKLASREPAAGKACLTRAVVVHEIVRLKTPEVLVE